MRKNAVYADLFGKTVVVTAWRSIARQRCNVTEMGNRRRCVQKDAEIIIFNEKQLPRWIGNPRS